MATVIISIILLLVLVYGIKSYCRRISSGCCGSDSGKAEKKLRVKDRNKSHYSYEKTLSVYGMTCANCARKVENALNSLEGVWASVDLSDGSVVVRMKTPIEEEELKDRVRTAGYTVLSIE